MKEKLISVETTRTGGSLKLKFRDIGKWSGRPGAGGTGTSGGFVDMMMASGVGGGAGLGEMRSVGSFMKKVADNTDGKNFVRISREFERIRAERKMMSTTKGASSVLRPTKGSVLRVKSEGGTIVNPMGHSSALGAFAGDNVF